MGVLPALLRHHHMVLHMVYCGLRRCERMGDGGVELEERSRCSYLFCSNHIDFDVGNISFGGGEFDTFLEEAGQQ